MSEQTWFPAGFGGDTVDLAELDGRLQKVHEENEALGRELLRCYEQLNLVFEITEHIASLQDPTQIEQDLIARFGTMLGAGALLIDRGGRAEPLQYSPLSRPVTVDGALVRRAVAEQIEDARRCVRSTVPELCPTARAALGGAHLLLGPLKHEYSDPAIVIALRHPSEPAFDSGDILASESVLGYGGFVLSNVLMIRRLQQMAVETVGALANAIDAKDNYTKGHSERVGWLAKITGQELGLSAAQQEVLEWAGVLHDVGKIGIPEGILNKPGKLTSDEFMQMKKHPRMSFEVLRPVSTLGPVLEAVLYHHENHDGSGYPEGLRGDQIPLSARIVHVVDIFDALTSTRSYRRAFDVPRALAILREEVGRTTDPGVTSAFVRAFTRHMEESSPDFAKRFAHLLTLAPTAPGADSNATAPAATAAGG